MEETTLIGLRPRDGSLGLRQPLHRVGIEGETIFPSKPPQS